MKLLNIIFAIIFILLIFGCKQDEWMSVVYPEKNNLLQDKILGVYPNLELCRKMALEYIRSKDYPNADYECGLNCKLENLELNFYICKETSR